MNTIFSVRNEDLNRLSASQAVSFFNKLLLAEASSIGIGKNLINVPSAITVADGGIDAEVRGMNVVGGQGIIKNGLNRYQIKTGDFSISNQSKIKEILFKENSSELKPRIKSCLDNNGRLVVVLFGWDNPDRTDDECLTNFREILSDLNKKYSNSDIEIWRQNILCSFFENFPSLSLSLTGRYSAHFQTHKSWSKIKEMRNEFKPGDAQIEIIENIREELRKNDGPIHLSIFGEAGIGKTKLVFEATNTDDLSPLIIYCDSPTKFTDSDLFNIILRDDNQFNSILVIDECNADIRRYIWSRIESRSPRIKLITIYNEFESTSKYFIIPNLDEEKINDIIQSYDVPKDSSDRWASFCEGFPRVAHLIGFNLINHPDDLLKSPEDVDIWNRFIAGSDDPNNENVKQRRLVLRYIALFKKFGFTGDYLYEAEAISKLVEEADNNITWQKFQEIIFELRKRKILQGENILYITPKLLHIYLWREWWSIYGNGFKIEDFLKKIPKSLHYFFVEMSKYAKESEVIDKFLAEDSPFKNDNFIKNDLGSNFFLALSEANPEHALKYLIRTIGKCSKEELLNFKIGRREIVWALEKIAMWELLFQGSARLLLALGEAENESISNNASGIFADLFSLGRKRLAPTEAPPQTRFPILIEALESDSKEKRFLALNACEKALEATHISRSVGAEYQGLRKEPEQWSPKTWAELFDAYRYVWKILFEKLDNLPEYEQNKAVDILLQSARGLNRYANLSNMIIETMYQLKDKSYVNENDIIKVVDRLLHYDSKNMEVNIKNKWEKLKKELLGSGFSANLKRYVGMNLIEDRYDYNARKLKIAKTEMDKLAEEAIKNNELLEAELHWLVTDKAKNGYHFGLILGHKDTEFTLLPMLLDAQRKSKENSNAFFLGGYFRAIFDKDQKKCEDLLDELVKDDVLRIWIPELTFRSNLTDKAAIRILELAKNYYIDPNSFGIFVYGVAVHNLSEEVFIKWIEFLLKTDKYNIISISLSLYDDFYLEKDSKHNLPEQLTFYFLTHPLFYQDKRRENIDQMDEYHWANIAANFIKLYPNRSIELAEKLLENFGIEGSIVDSSYSESINILDKITKSNPSEIWNICIKFIGPPIDSRAYWITRWLRKGALDKIPLDDVWKWVDEKPDKRAWYLAHFTPNVLFRDKSKICLVRELLVKYGNIEDVQNELIANFSTETWSGPASLHFLKKKEQLLDFKKEEENSNVINWIDKFVSVLGEDIKRERNREERRGF